MKKIIALALISLFATGVVSAQHCGNCPHHRQQQARQQSCQPQVNADGIDMAIVKAFPEVKSVKKAEKWTEVYNAQSKLLGYAVYSKPASDGIKGYAGETPVLIALNPKQVITGVYLLANSETPKFAQHVQESGFYNNWNGLTVKKAKKKQVDTVSGATFTSRAVIQSVQAALNTL
jgi:Na+-translocating ferredoxin:NAD+ oxidoreductase RnfG subunit